MKRRKQEMHGKRNTKTYDIWNTMKQRCYNRKSISYKNYGARGITVCDRWRNSFSNFLNDMGEKEDGMSIDRIDVNGNYEPSNCRWANKIEQCNNTRVSHYLVYNGEIKTVTQWARILNVKSNSVLTRVRRGWEINKIFNTPLPKNKCSQNQKKTK